MTIKMTIPGTDFYLHVVVEKDVPQLEISVNYLVLVEVLDAKQDLVHEVPRLRLGDGLAALVELHQRPPAAQLHDDVDEVSVLEVAEQLMERKTKTK